MNEYKADLDVIHADMLRTASYFHPQRFRPLDESIKKLGAIILDIQRKSVDPNREHPAERLKRDLSIP